MTVGRHPRRLVCPLHVRSHRCLGLRRITREHGRHPKWFHIRHVDSIPKKKRKNLSQSGISVGHWNTFFRSKHTKLLSHTHTQKLEYGGDDAAEGDSAAQAVRHLSSGAPCCVLLLQAMWTGGYFTGADIPGIPVCCGEWWTGRRGAERGSQGGG